LIQEHPKGVIIFDKNISCVGENRLPLLDYTNIELIKGDITQIDEAREPLKGIDFVVHTASPLTPFVVNDIGKKFCKAILFLPIAISSHLSGGNNRSNEKKEPSQLWGLSSRAITGSF
jgi:hypothetical protein